MSGDVVAGRFALCDPIASGGTGTVWRAWDLRQGRYCAAKVLRQRDVAELMRFVREQAVRLTHPNLLTPYGWVAEDEHVVIATDLMSNGSVATLIGDWGPLATDTVGELLRQLLAGLAHVHAAGLIHRDVKPANMLLDTDRSGITLRLADWGLVVSTEDVRLTRHGHVVGTPAYLAPESMSGAAPAPEQDLYAAGLVAHALLVGAEPITPVPSVDQSELAAHGVVGMVVRALLAEDPAARPSASDAGQALAAASERRPCTAAGDPVLLVDQLPPLPAGWTAAGPRKPTDPGRGRRTLLLVGAGLAAALWLAALIYLIAQVIANA